MPSPAATLGIIAGAGEWPAILARAGQEQGRKVFVLAISDNADEAVVADLAHEWIGLGQVGKAISILKREGCEDVVMAGPVKRVSLKSIKLDWRATKLLPQALKAKGDDGLLSLLVKELESEGFQVIGPDHIIGDLLAPLGAVGALSPDPEQLADIARGIAVVAALGALDVGQAVIVQQGFVLGVEAAEGTDGLIERCAALHRDGSGGVLIKISKPGQNRHVDLPTIGVDTITKASAAGLAGIAIEAGGALIVDRDGVARTADEGKSVV